MRKSLIIISLVFFGLSFNYKAKFKPPGIAQINDSLYADITEVSNFSWREFELWTINKYGKYSKEHLAVLPDTLVWQDKKAYNEPYVKFYYRHPAYNDYPVVGINYEQATQYCKWRTERVETLLNIKKKFNRPKFEYRLPTNNEWEMLASASTMFFNNNGKDEKGKANFNCLNNDTSITSEYADVTSHIHSYKKDIFGLYNVIGNVSEIIYEKGYSKGGSWKDNIEDCRIGKVQTYTAPTSWLGFRCVCIIKK